MWMFLKSRHCEVMHHYRHIRKVILVINLLTSKYINISKHSKENETKMQSQISLSPDFHER